MAVIKLYKYSVDTDLYESDCDVFVREAIHSRYRNPLYTTSLYQVATVRDKYGDDYVDVYEAEIDIDWEPVDWTKINEVPKSS